MHTPEFVRWTIALPCSLREASDWSLPEATERLLRPLRECSRAMSEGQVRDGLAVPRERNLHASGDPWVLRIDDCIAGRGSVQSLNRLCLGCPANASLLGDQPCWAGCYGELPRHGPRGDLALRMEELFDRQAAGAAVCESVPPTTPRWYGLWMHPAIEPERLPLWVELFRSLAVESPEAHEFFLATHAALRGRLSLMVELSPQGELSDTEWIVAAHCPRCKAARSPGRGRCPACGEQNHSLPARRRKRRGDRPYRRLTSVLGAEGASEFLASLRSSSVQGD